MSELENSILRALLASRDTFVSGEQLAEQLGVSRVAIWQHMEKLRAGGFGFEAVRNVGYRMTHFPAALHAALLAHLVAAAAPLKHPPQIVIHETLDSTNDEATRRLAAGADAPLVVIAREQTRGRGRFGRLWHSEPNGNLYISFAFRPRATPARMQTFTLWMGANVCDLIAAHVKNPPGVKWPNDILFDGRKAGGMLTEARIDADQIRDLVFGLGLNLNSDTARWPADIVRRATSLAGQNGGAPLDANAFAAALIARVLACYEQFVAEPEAAAATLAVLWKKYDLLRGNTITLVFGNERATGVAEGIDAEGSLILRPPGGGRPQKFRAGEVTIEKKA